MLLGGGVGARVANGKTAPEPRAWHSAGMARLRVNIVFESGARIGPGKVKLLESIRDAGSIWAAARDMGMSYKPAWLLLDSISQAFTESVVTAAPDASGGGGATLTPFGAKCSNAIIASMIGRPLWLPTIWSRSRGGRGQTLRQGLKDALPPAGGAENHDCREDEIRCHHRWSRTRLRRRGCRRAPRHHGRALPVVPPAGRALFRARGAHLRAAPRPPVGRSPERGRCVASSIRLPTPRCSVRPTIHTPMITKR